MRPKANRPFFRRQFVEDGKNGSRLYSVCDFLGGRWASTMASVLSATAKNCWEGGGRRGVKLAVAMGSHWLNMQVRRGR